MIRASAPILTRAALRGQEDFHVNVAQVDERKNFSTQGDDLSRLGEPVEDAPRHRRFQGGIVDLRLSVASLPRARRSSPGSPNATWPSHRRVPFAGIALRHVLIVFFARDHPFREQVLGTSELLLGEFQLTCFLSDGRGGLTRVRLGLGDVGLEFCSKQRDLNEAQPVTWRLLSTSSSSSDSAWTMAFLLLAGCSSSSSSSHSAWTLAFLLLAGFSSSSSSSDSARTSCSRSAGSGLRLARLSGSATAGFLLPRRRPVRRRQSPLPRRRPARQRRSFLPPRPARRRLFPLPPRPWPARRQQAWRTASPLPL